jgi:hypothetical protein
VRLNGGTLHLVDSTVTEDSGAVEVEMGSATIERSLLAGSSPVYVWTSLGLVVDFDAEAQLINSTVVGIRNGGLLTIVNSTITAGDAPFPWMDAFAYDDFSSFVCQGMQFSVSTGHATSVNSVIEGSCSIGVPTNLPPDFPQPACFPPPPAAWDDDFERRQRGE